MPGNATSGNRTGARGKPTRRRRRITKDAALALRVLAWERYQRPTTDEEEDGVLSALVMEEKERLLSVD